MKVAMMVGALALAGMVAGCGPRRGTELNNDWFIGDWAPSRACTPSEFTSFLRDGSYTAPMNATRRALGIWSFSNGVLNVGTIMQQDHFRITRVSDTELRSEPVDAPEAGATLYRCSR